MRCGVAVKRGAVWLGFKEGGVCAVRDAKKVVEGSGSVVVVVRQDCPCTCPSKSGVAVMWARGSGGNSVGYTKEGVQAPRRLRCETRRERLV